MHQTNKTHILAKEREHIGDLYDHADQLLDNLADIKDVFDTYLAAKLYNWRYKWFCEHYEPHDWTTDDGDLWSFEEITFDSIPYNVCTNWDVDLDKYFEADRPIYLPSDKMYSDICRSKIDNGGIVPFYFRSQIDIPEHFELMFTDITATNEDGEAVLKNNLTQLQLEDYEKNQEDYL